MKSRRAAMTEADLKLIQEFTASLPSQQNQQQPFEMMIGLFIGFIIVIVLMVRRMFVVVTEMLTLAHILTLS